MWVAILPLRWPLPGWPPAPRGHHLPPIYHPVGTEAFQLLATIKADLWEEIVSGSSWLSTSELNTPYPGETSPEHWYQTKLWVGDYHILVRYLVCYPWDITGELALHSHCHGQLELVPEGFISMSPMKQTTPVKAESRAHLQPPADLDSHLRSWWMQHLDGSWFLLSLKQHLPTLSHLVLVCLGGVSMRTRAWGRQLPWRSSASPHNFWMSVAIPALFVCGRGERIGVVLGEWWLSQWFDAKGCCRCIDLNMPHSLWWQSGGFWDYWERYSNHCVWMYTNKASGLNLIRE